MRSSKINGYDRAAGFIGGSIVGAALSIISLTLISKQTSVDVGVSSLSIVVASIILVAVIGAIFPKPFSWVTEILHFW